MKKIILVLTLISVSFFSYAQTKDRLDKGKQSAGQYLDHVIDDAEEAFHKMRYGIKGGINFSNVTGMTNSSSIIGFDAGVYGRIPVAEAVGFFIAPELLISKRGFKPAASSTVNHDSVTNLYLDIPVMFGFAPRALKGLFVEVGPKMGFALNKGNYVDRSLASKDEKASGFDFALSIGAGFDFGRYLKMPGGISLVGRYNIGLTNVYKFNPERSNKNSGFSLGLAYHF